MSMLAHAAAAPAPLAANIPIQWMLRGDVAYLNHGCFGARPRAVHQAFVRWTELFEQEPIDALERRRSDSLRNARARLAGFLGAEPDDIGMVTNATAGVNAVLRSLHWRAGDELLTVDHVYNAVRKSMQWLARQFGITIREVPVPVPLNGPRDVVDRIAGALTQRTRLLIIDHVTSPTAIRLPVEEIIRLCAERGIDVLVDGAHAPGMVDLNVADLDAAYYVGNLHKWVCAPIGAAFLWVRRDRQDSIRPLVISHFLDDGFTQSFTWQGTQSIAPWLCVSDALDYFDRFGWDAVRRYNHQLAMWVQRMLAERWGIEPLTPLDASMLGSMAAVRLPGELMAFAKPEEIITVLRERHRIEAPVFDWNGIRLIRPSCQIYNSPEEYERLGDAIESMRGAT